MVIISLPLMDYMLPISSKKSDNRENRVYATFPEFNIQHLDPFPGQFDNFYRDHFHFRGELLELNKYVKLKIYKESPHPAVIIGKRGWLYTNKYINSYTGRKIFSSQELTDFNKMYTRRSEWLRNHGIKNYIVIIPTKFNVYPEYLPKSIFRERLINEKKQFIEAVSAIDNLRVIDLEPYLLNKKKESAIRSYHITDQHWNEYGAFLAYAKIIEEIHNDFPEVPLVNEDDFIIDSILVPGRELAKTILIEMEVNEMDVTVKAKEKKSVRFMPENIYPVPEKFPYKKDFQLHYKTPDNNLPKILVFRDSYTNAMLHLLPESFSETVLIWDNWGYRLNENIVEKEKPDIFLTLIIESNLPFILHKHPTER